MKASTKTNQEDKGTNTETRQRENNNKKPNNITKLKLINRITEKN